MALQQPECVGKCDVFVSHSHTDEAIAKEITSRLNESGITTYEYGTAEDWGRPILANVLAAITNSKKTLLLVSKAFMKSDYFVFECMETKNKECRTGYVALIPVLLDVTPEELHSMIASSKAIEYKKEPFYEKLMKAVTDDLKTTEVLPAGDVGTGMAWGFYFGYLNLKLPTFLEQLETAYTSEDYSTANIEKKVTNFKKLIILIPTSCICLDDLDKFVGIKKVTEVAFQKNRGGIQKRNYKSILYFISHSSKPEVYSATVEFATPILSMWEMHKDSRTILNAEQLEHQRKVFTIKLNEILENDIKCRNKVFLMDYHDPEDLQDKSKPALADAIWEQISMKLAVTGLHEFSCLQVADADKH